MTIRATAGPAGIPAPRGAGAAGGARRVRLGWRARPATGVQQKGDHLQQDVWAQSCWRFWCARSAASGAGRTSMRRRIDLGTLTPVLTTLAAWRLDVGGLVCSASFTLQMLAQLPHDEMARSPTVSRGGRWSSRGAGAVRLDRGDGRAAAGCAVRRGSISFDKAYYNGWCMASACIHRLDPPCLPGTCWPRRTARRSGSTR